jgi:hypothetical protein
MIYKKGGYLFRICANFKVKFFIIFSNYQIAMIELESKQKHKIHNKNWPKHRHVKGLEECAQKCNQDCNLRRMPGERKIKKETDEQEE